MYQPTNVQKLFAAALDDGRSALSADDLSHWVAAAVSGAGTGFGWGKLLPQLMEAAPSSQRA